MLQNKDYTHLTLEALLAEEKKIKKGLTLTAFIIGLLFGIIIFSVVRNGFRVVPTLIPAILIFLSTRNSNKQKIDLQTIRAEISARNESRKPV